MKTSDRNPAQVEKVPPWSKKMAKLFAKPVIGWILFLTYHSILQIFRKIMREAVLAPLMTILSTVKCIKQIINVRIPLALGKSLENSTKTYMANECTLCLNYVSYYFCNFVWLALFFYIPDESGNVREWKSGDDSHNFKNLNWQSFLYLQLSVGVCVRYAPLFTPYASFWVADHTGYKHDLEANATSVPDTCQRTTSFYGPFATILLHGMNYHCEHHDHPAVPACYLPRLRKMYPEFYEHLHFYDNCYFTPLYRYVRDRGVGWKYAHCE